MNDEETKTEVSKTDETGIQPDSSDSLFERTDKAAARIEAANKKTEELLNRQEEIYAKSVLGGKADAGQKEEKPKEMDPVEYAKKVMNGEIDGTEKD